MLCGVRGLWFINLLIISIYYHAQIYNKPIPDLETPLFCTSICGIDCCFGVDRGLLDVDNCSALFFLFGLSDSIIYVVFLRVSVLFICHFVVFLVIFSYGVAVVRGGRSLIQLRR